jgi:hypothetical protein
MTTKTLSLSLAVALAMTMTIGACSSPPVVEQVPVGTDVQVVRQDGAVVTGKLAARDEKTVQVDDGRRTREVPREQIADVQVVEPSKPTPLPPVARFREFTVPAGTSLVVKLEKPVASNTSHVEDAVEATLAEPVMVDGTTVLPAGSRVRGEVAAAQPSGKVKGRANLALRFGTISVDDETYAFDARVSRAASGTKREDAAKIGIPAGAGAIIGGIVGGRKGAAIGATVGGGAGTAVVLSTTGDEVHMPSGTTLSLPIDSAIEVRVPVAKP